jgi:hypothetical protein
MLLLFIAAQQVYLAAVQLAAALYIGQVCSAISVLQQTNKTARQTHLMATL